MKNYIALILLFFCVSATAQYYGNPDRGIGVDRRLTGQTNQMPKKKKQEKVDMFEIYVKKLNEKLKFDSFQVAVVQQLLKENKAEEDRLVAQDIPIESKYEQIMVMREKLNLKIREILTPEQTVEFEKIAAKKK